MAHLSNTEFQPLNIAVLTVSDTRNLDTDTSGQALIDGLQSAGHTLAERAIVRTTSGRSAPGCAAGSPAKTCRWC